MGRVTDNGLERLRDFASEASLQAPDVSGWSIGMHVHHCALGMIGMCNAVLESSPPVPKSRFSALRTLVLATGRIPRGRGKAPEMALPNPDLEPSELNALLDQSKVLIGRVAEANRDQWWEHFIFGSLNRDQTLRFIGIHNGHHLRIMTDIRAAAG